MERLFAIGLRQIPEPQHGLLFALTGIVAVSFFVPGGESNDRSTIAFCLLGCAELAVFWPLVVKIDELTPWAYTSQAALLDVA